MNTSSPANLVDKKWEKARLLFWAGAILAVLSLLSACRSWIDRPRSYAVALGDLNGDGYLDAFYANGRGDTNGAPDQVWFNNGGGVFTDSHQRLEDAPGRGVALGDLNGDGALDALVANTAQHPNMVFINDGQGFFRLSPQSWSIPQDALPGGSTLSIGDTTALALGDLDNDGDLDAFTSDCCWEPADGQQDAYSLVWLNNGAGRFYFWQALGSGRVDAVVLGDLDGDGDLDAFVGSRGLPNVIWFNQGGLQGGIPGEFSDSGGSFGQAGTSAVALGDLDNDGDLDAFLGNKSLNQVWLNDGGLQGGIMGHFSDSRQRLSRLDTRMLALNDLDEDGDLDAFVGGVKDGEIWLNDGMGNFANSRLRLAYSQNHVLALGDVDGDGDADVLVGSFAQGYKLWLNQGGVQGGVTGQFSQGR